ncbi:MAG: ribosome silencing factor [Ferrovum sp.]|nr:ribosome silencing factor [Ferrovum sp.]
MKSSSSPEHTPPSVPNPTSLQRWVSNPSLLAQTVIQALEDIKAKDIEQLEVRTLTSLFDTLIIASADSTRQTRALARHVEDQVRALGAPILSTDGQHSGEWILVVLGSVIVHIMQPAVRTYYDLTTLWQRPGNRLEAPPRAA